MKAREIDIFLNVYKFWGYAVRDKGAEKAIVKFKEIDEYLVMHKTKTAYLNFVRVSHGISLQIRWLMEYPREYSIEYLMKTYSDL